MTTLQEIKVEHARLAGMIAQLEAQAKLAAAYPITLNIPELKEGEKYIGAIISADGSKRHHLILLPGERDDINWKDAMDWAAGIGGELPDRTESALLFATMKDEFKPEWYWTREQSASYSTCAWSQHFDYGYQTNSFKSFEGRARAIRRVEI